MADLTAAFEAAAIRDLMHDRMGQAEQLEGEPGNDDLSEEAQDALCERYEAALSQHLPEDMTEAAATCVNVSFYGRKCTLPPHGWRQSCQFEEPPEEEGSYEQGGSTLRDLLEDCSAGGLVALNAAMRWIEYSLYHGTEMTRQTHHELAIRVAEHAHATAQEEQQKLFNYLRQEVSDART